MLSNLTKRIKYCSCFILMVLFWQNSYATHITGGVMTYKYLGGNNYEMTLSFYQDYVGGNPDAISQDVPAYVRVYKGNGYFVQFDSLHNYVSSIDSARCPGSNLMLACTRKMTFTHIYNLPPDSNGYYIVYQRCCRNASIVNLANPLDVGATYYCHIPAPAVAHNNSSIVFNHEAPGVAPLNNPMTIDMSATDVDGDSLSYELSQPLAAGDNTNSKPIPQPPPYQSLHFSYPFSYTNPMSASPTIQIDPVSGIISGTPDAIGSYVITLSCNEWRNGAKINTTRREFELVVTNCGINNGPIGTTNSADVMIPSAFTPNGDGVNDIFRPVFAFSYENAFTIKYIKVFDKNGAILYNGNKGWDGSYKGMRMDIGVYLWYLSMEDNNGKQYEMKGKVTLIR